MFDGTFETRVIASVLDKLPLAPVRVYFRESGSRSTAHWTDGTGVSADVAFRADFARGGATIDLSPEQIEDVRRKVSTLATPEVLLCVENGALKVLPGTDAF